MRAYHCRVCKKQQSREMTFLGDPLFPIMKKKSYLSKKGSKIVISELVDSMYWRSKDEA